jgi:hypothetical protein
MSLLLQDDRTARVRTDRRREERTMLFRHDLQVGAFDSMENFPCKLLCTLPVLRPQRLLGTGPKVQSRTRSASVSIHNRNMSAHEAVLVTDPDTRTHFSYTTSRCNPFEIKHDSFSGKSWYTVCATEKEMLDVQCCHGLTGV